MIERQGTVPYIPSKANRRWKSCFTRTLDKGRNAPSACYAASGYHRITTGYDKLATNFLGAIYLAVAVTWWSWVPTLAEADANGCLYGID